ncbi:MAG: hypothetical protein ABIY55_35930, partial [Kofleriaceae bacterium]
MTINHSSLRAWVALGLALGACGVDTAPDLPPSALSATIAGPLDPFLTCAWGHGFPLNQDIGVTGYGYAGEHRGFRIYAGDYHAAGNYLEYKIEVIWTLPGCGGTVYYLRFPNHGLADHAELEVRDAAGALEGKLVASAGSLPVLSNQNGTALPTHALGPFVITDAMVGGSAGMADTITFTLLDAQLLIQLPYPAFYNGALPTTVAQSDALARVHETLVADNAYLFTFFQFRRAIAAMTSSERQVASDNIDLVKDLPGPIHAGDTLWEEHHHVDHSVAVGPAAVGVGFGGFWNGHRNLLLEIERHLRERPTVTPFGRVPI